jgi:mono/diheme cytochrome c family protein
MKSARVMIAGLLVAGFCRGQNPGAMVKRGENIFATTCATGYCHGVRGTASGAPRLAGRGFNGGYIYQVVSRGISGTGMQSFAARLSQPDLAAVVSYVASLNGVAAPGPGEGQERPEAGPALSAEAARGQRVFTEATRSFGRCSTCHEVGGLGISVATPIVRVPESVAALRALATPDVKTATAGSETMPALVLSNGKRETLFYDLTSVPPVERNAEPGSVVFTDTSNWRHSAVIGAYNDSELGAILIYLRETIKP